MPKAFEGLPGGEIAGHVGLGIYGGAAGTVKRQVYDGDAVTVRGLGNFGTRLLGIDTTEKKIPLPGETSFTSLSSPDWDGFLSAPFTEAGSLSPSPFSQAPYTAIDTVSGLLCGSA